MIWLCPFYEAFPIYEVIMVERSPKNYPNSGDLWHAMDTR